MQQLVRLLSTSRTGSVKSCGHVHRLTAVFTYIIIELSMILTRNWAIDCHYLIGYLALIKDGIIVFSQSLPV
ncbi:hypothetical protein T06_9153 [Trichinella sp. T6]|nr:hypothetical protein T06_9153 [Trichinella sp. T6]